MKLLLKRPGKHQGRRIKAEMSGQTNESLNWPPKPPKRRKGERGLRGCVGTRTGTKEETCGLPVRKK